MAKGLGPHLSRQQIEKLADNALEGAERRRVVRHLLAGCARCRRIAATRWPFELATHREEPNNSVPLQPGGDLEETLTRVLQKVESRRNRIAETRRQAPRLFSEIEALPFERSRLLLANGHQFHTWAFAYYLSERAEGAGFDDAARAIELAELAILVAERVEATEQRIAHDLLGHCWATLGNAQRIAGSLPAAQEALAIAAEWLSQGTGDPLEEGRHLSLVASLRREQRRFQEALDLQSKAASVYRRIGDTNLLGRVLVGKAKILDDLQQPEQSVMTLRKALPLLDPDRDPLVVLAAYHNLALSLSELDRSEEALALLEIARPLYRRQGNTLNLLRLRWLEGKIEQRGGRHLAACRAFLEVRDAFLARDMGYEAALVTLDLAMTYLETGNHFEVRKLAAGAIPIFERLGIQREAFAALLALREAVQREILSGALLRELYSRASSTRGALR